jgi:hypothetical protein
MGFFTADASDFLGQKEPRRIEADRSYIGVVLTSEVNDLPDQVDLKWTMFNDYVDLVRGVVFTRNRGELFTCTPEMKSFSWTNPGDISLPKIESVMVKDKEPDLDQQTTIITSLLGHIYESFELHDESNVYDALDRNVDGDLLAELYLKIKRSLVMQEQGGAVARVQDLFVTDVRSAENAIPNGFSCIATWQLDGTVEHWGHMHTRVNEYSAEITVVDSGDVWKMRSMRVMAQKQIKVRTALRML